MNDIKVLVNGTPVKKYFDNNGNVWIEARKGSSFSIKITNETYKRSLAVVSVDGLNVINGKHLIPEEGKGYIINKYSSINIPGWKINENDVKEFYFTTKEEESYARKIGADERNIGVIACAFFPEKINYTYSYATAYSVSGSAENPIYTNDIWLGRDTANSEVIGSVNAYNCSVTVDSNSGYIKESPVESVSVGSGQQVEYRTYSIDFERDVLSHIITIYYDTWDGLKRRGILRDDKDYREYPKAFPSNGNYCPDV